MQFEPTVVESFDGLESDIAKIVGVSDDHGAVAAAATAAADEFGDRVSSSRSQPYYLDITHPLANKGAVARFLSARYAIPPEEIATIGDMPNDVLMFAHSGLSIAMGNADREVQRAARRVTTSNDDDGFANAVERFILRRRERASGHGHPHAARNGRPRPDGRRNRPAPDEGRPPVRRLRRLAGRREGARGRRAPKVRPRSRSSSRSSRSRARCG